MSAPNPFAGTDFDFDPALHWGAFPAPAARTYTGQSVAGHDPSGADMFSQTNGEATIDGVIDAKRLRAFQRWALGYNNMTTTAYYTLQRENPIVHPIYTSMVCTSVASTQFKPIRKNPPLGSTNSGLKIPKNGFDTSWVAVANTGSEAKTFPFYTGYEKAHVVCRFTPTPYAYLNDSETGKEYARNTIVDTEPRTEVLTLSGFQIIFAEGDGNAGAISNPKGAVSPSDAYILLSKPDLKITTHLLPEKFLSKNTTVGYFYPEKVVRALGKLNKYDFLSWKKGTLLLMGARFTRHFWPLAAGRLNFGVPLDTLESIFNYDMELLFSYFNPDKGYASNVRIVNPDTFGHNNHPWRGATPGTVLTGADANQGLWFYATYSGKLVDIGGDAATSDQGIYRYTNFDNIWDSAWTPDLT